MMARVATTQDPNRNTTSQARLQHFATTPATGNRQTMAPASEHIGRLSAKAQHATSNAGKAANRKLNHQPRICNSELHP